MYRFFNGGYNMPTSQLLLPNCHMLSQDSKIHLSASALYHLLQRAILRYFRDNYHFRLIDISIKITYLFSVSTLDQNDTKCVGSSADVQLTKPTLSACKCFRVASSVLCL